MVSPTAKSIVVCLALIGWAGAAAADSITIINDRRAVSVLALVVDDSGHADRRTDSQGPGDALSADVFASVGTSVANSVARLTSSITDPAHLSGSGSALASFATFHPAAASSVASEGERAALRGDRDILGAASLPAWPPPRSPGLRGRYAACPARRRLCRSLPIFEQLPVFV